MQKLEVFMDITCPYCLRGYNDLMKTLPKHSNAQLDWRIVEAHPKNEEPEHRPYVDIAVQSALMVKELGLDECRYVGLLFNAVFEERANIEDINVLISNAEKIGADSTAMRAALAERRYADAGLAANDYAFEQKGVWAVPTFVCGDKRLDAAEGIGVTEVQIDKLLSDCFE